MGLFSRKSKTTNTVKRTPAFDQLGDYVLKNASQVFGRGFQAYEGQRFADFTQDEQKGFDLARAFADPTDSLADQLETQALERFQGSPTLDRLRGFINPFTEQVIDRALYNTTRSYDAQRAKLASRQASGGAYGGSRFAVAQNELEDSLLDTIADTTYRGQYDAYNQGLNNFYKTGLDAFNLSQGAKKSEADRFNTLLAIGGQQRGLDQLNRDFDYQEFIRSINEPKSDLLSAGQLLASYPVQSFDTEQKTKTSPSVFSAIGGIAGLAAGVAGIPGAAGLTSSIFGGGAAAAGGAAGIAGSSSGISSQPYWSPIFGGQQSNGSFGVAPITATLLNSGQYAEPSGAGVFKDGGLVTKKDPFEKDEKKKSKKKDPFVEERGGITNDQKLDKKSEVVIEDSLKFADGGFVEDLWNKLKWSPEKRQKLFNALGYGEKGDVFNQIIGDTKKKPDLPNSLSSNKSKSIFERYPVPKQQTKNPFQPETKAPDVRTVLNQKSVFDTPQAQNKPQTNQTTVPELKEEKSWMDRWMENPLTQIGIALMQGSGPDVLGGFGDALQANYQQSEQAEQQALETQQRHQIDANNEAQRRQEAAAALELQKQRYAQEYQADMARIAAAKEQNKTQKDLLFMNQIEGRLNNLQNARIDLITKMNDPSNTGNPAQYAEAIKQIDREMIGLRGKFSDNVGLKDPFGLLE